MHLLGVGLPRPVAVAAVHALARVDYTIANRVSDDVAATVEWAYAHDAVWLARAAVELLHSLDASGSVLISFVVWLVGHTP